VSKSSESYRPDLTTSRCKNVPEECHLTNRHILGFSSTVPYLAERNAVDQGRR
jgi:hypothetical protein